MSDDVGQHHAAVNCVCRIATGNEWTGLERSLQRVYNISSGHRTPRRRCGCLFRALRRRKSCLACTNDFGGEKVQKHHFAQRSVALLIVLFVCMQSLYRLIDVMNYDSKLCRTEKKFHSMLQLDLKSPSACAPLPCTPLAPQSGSFSHCVRMPQHRCLRWWI